MPLSKGVGNFGTNSDVSNTEEFYIFCSKSGDFTNLNPTLEDMVQSSIENVTADLQIPFEPATHLANSFIPTLKGWQ